VGRFGKRWGEKGLTTWVHLKKLRGVFSFPKLGWARGLGGHDFFFCFRGPNRWAGGRVCFNFPGVGRFEPSNIIFGSWRCRGYLDLSFFFNFLIIG